MAWKPRFPLRAAERHVRFEEIGRHIYDRRRLCYEAILPTSRRFANAMIDMHGGIPQGALDEITQSISDALAVTFRFGYREVRREIKHLKGGKVLAAQRPPKDQDQVAAWIAAIAAAASLKYADKMRGHYEKIVVTKTTTDEAGTEQARAESQAALGKKADAEAWAVALGTVSVALNGGRSMGATGAVPFAMRSEQIESDSCCDYCVETHGTVVSVDGPDYWDLMPPNGCYGDERCRGLYVYSDDVADFA